MAPRSVGTRQVPWCGHSCPHSPPFYVLHQYIDGDTPSPYQKVDFLLWPTINQPRKAIDFPSIYPKLPGFSANSRFSICPQPESVFVNAVAGRPSLSAMDRKTNNHHSPPSPQRWSLLLEAIWDVMAKVQPSVVGRVHKGTFTTWRWKTFPAWLGGSLLPSLPLPLGSRDTVWLRGED